jgi:hypothetical protein
MQTALSPVETVKAAFNFSVDKFPLQGPDALKTPWYGLFRSDNSLPVGGGSVTSRYVPHTTDDVVAMVEAVEVAFEGVAQVKCYFDEGHYVSIMPSKEHRLSVFGTADNIFPRLIVRAGYDGRCFNASMGYYRDLCRNMSILRQVGGTTVSIRHTSGLRGKMDALIAQFQGLKNSWGKLSERVLTMQAETVQMADFLKDVYGEPEADAGRSVTIHKNRTEAIFRRLMNERGISGRGRLGNDWMVSKWEAFNAVQGYVQHDATRKGGLEMFGRAMAAMNDSAVHRAEELLMVAA